MDPRPFAGFNPRPSAWGYNWTTEIIPVKPDHRKTQNSTSNTTGASSPEPEILAQQYANMPAALLTSLKRDKKPFTYTPGGVNLNEVLNARLQKRMERKKKYSEERMANESKNTSNPVDRLPRFDPTKQLIVMPTYNTPLDMYSMENALEALEVQAELVAADKSLSGPSRSATLPRNHKFDDRDFDSNKGVAQSKAFRVLQIITDTDEEPNDKGKGHNSIDEMRFTGLRDNKTIPSKFFQTLQKITGTDEDAEEENTHDVAKPAIFEKQLSRAGHQQQSRQQAAPAQSHPMQNHMSQPQFQPQKQVHFQDQVTNSPGLKRPAAFLPMKTGGDPMFRVKPVHPPFLTNGPRNIFNSSGGTDF